MEVGQPGRGRRLLGSVLGARASVPYQIVTVAGASVGAARTRPSDAAEQLAFLAVARELLTSYAAGCPVEAAGAGARAAVEA